MGDKAADDNPAAQDYIDEVRDDTEQLDELVKDQDELLEDESDEPAKRKARTKTRGSGFALPAIQYGLIPPPDVKTFRL